MGWRVCPPRGDSARTGQIPRRHKNGEYAAVTRGRPAFQRHEARAEGSDTAPRIEVPKKHCVQEGTARIHRRKAPTLRKPFFCRNKPRTGLFRHSHSGRRVVIPPPHRNAEKMQNGSLITSPNRAPAETASLGFGGKKAVQRSERVLPLAAGRGIRRPLGRQPAKRFRWEEDERQRERVLPLAAGRGIRRPLGRQPAKRFRWEEDERQRERVLPLAAGRGIRRPLGRQPASHLSGLRRSRCPAKCTGRGMAPHPISGRKPGPTFSYDWRKT